MARIKESIEENKTKGNLLQILCVKCSRQTNHIVSVSVDVAGSEEYDDDYPISWQDQWQVVQCRGCNQFSFRHANWFSEWEDHYSGADGCRERLYPERDVTSLKPREFRNVPRALRRIYRETIECFNNDCPIACAAALRGLVEGICADRKVTDGPVEKPAEGGGTQMVQAKNLEGKIAGLCEMGVLTKASAETLHAHRYLGNDAMHELAQPSTDELKLAIEIIEHTLEQIYEMEGKAAELKQQRADRRKLGPALSGRN